MSFVTRFFHPVMPVHKLGRGPIRVQVAGRSFVLFRDADGRAAAFVDACPHRKAPLSAGRVRPDGRLQCPYHGWHFDAGGHGVSPSQPSLKRCHATVMQLREQHEYLWLAELQTPASALPQIRWEGFESAGAFTTVFEAPLHVALDNFSEDEHTPWVHTRLGWNEADVHTIEYNAQNFDDRTEVVYRARQRATLLRHIIGIRKGDVFNNEWTTRFDPVRTIYDIFWTDPRTGQSRGVVTRSTIFMVPETARRTRFHVFVNVKITARRYALIKPLVKAAALALGWWEIRDDARFIPTIADTPEDMTGMRLGKYDKPLIHNHRLLRRLYWGGEDNVRVLTAARTRES